MPTTLKKNTQLMNKPKEMLELVNNLACNKIKNKCVPSKLKINVKEITDHKEICEEFLTNILQQPLGRENTKSFHDNSKLALPKKVTNLQLIPSIQNPSVRFRHGSV